MLGIWEELGSNLFKIIIDELGYGVFSEKHSTLFENTLRSVGLKSQVQYYWQYYLNGSLFLANYYNMITRNKRHIFRYIGAIFLAETSFIKSCSIWRDALKEALPKIDVKYFDEHCHIDTHHSRMVFDGLVRPAIDQFGTLAANEIIRGFEEAKWIGDFAEQDFVNQIAWKNDAIKLQHSYQKIINDVLHAADKGKVKFDNLDEPVGELSITHCHDQDELCHVISGEMEFINGFEHSTTLRDGAGIVIRKNRLHGALIHSNNCHYQIYAIDEAEKWMAEK